MKGRTKSFFEDTFVLLIIVALLVGIYLFFFGDDKVKESLPEPKIDVQKPIEPKDELVQIDQEINTTIKKTNVAKEQSPLQKLEQKEQKEVPKPPIKQIIKNTPTKEVNATRIANLVKNVDLRALKNFKTSTKEKIQNQLILDNMIHKSDQNFSIRVTVLKDGNYEQLVFKGGNKNTYEQNKQNILKVFPLKISPSIEGDFPRYLRYKFQF